MTTLMQASHQWASRPADQRFLSLHELGAKTGYERKRSAGKVISSRSVTIEPAKDDPIRGLQIVGGQGNPAAATHWSFGQLASLAGAPASYMRGLPAPLAADCMNFGLKIKRDVEDVGLLLTKQEDDTLELRAATGPRYGRVWNSDIVDALVNRFGDGRTGDFRVPGEFGQQVPITRDNTTIYGSDRDMFVFLADEENRIEMANRRDGKPGSLARGFFVWNSEVGSQSLGAAFFLFDYVCMNRIVWGVQQFKEIRLRHTVSAPDKWLGEIAPVLTEYANAAAGPVEQTIKAAQEKKLGDDLDKFLASRFTRAEMTQVKQAHEREEGRPIETLWDVTTAITAHAKTIEWQDERVAWEREGGKVLDLVAA